MQNSRADDTAVITWLLQEKNFKGKLVDITGL